MDEHKKYLTDRLLSEELPITYRLLSRALDVHVNTAKEMLYDYHKYQNGLRADSVHATYLVFGTKTAEDAQGDGDVEMASSMPEPEALSEDAPTATLTIVAEEKLNGILAEYQNVTSIHVYSLAPHPQRDLALLADGSQSLSAYTKEDALTAAKKYGTIVNPQVRRRNCPSQVKAAPVAAPAAAPKPAVKQEPAPAKPTQGAKVKQEAAESTSKATTPSSSAAKSTPTLKRGGSGGIMQSFAKAKPPKAKPAVKKEEDSAMALSDDGEADDADMPAAKKAPADAEAVRKSKKDREDELRRMMEEDDDDEEEAEEKDDEADEEMEDPEPEPEPEAEPETASQSKADEPAEVVSSTGDGRRRGKRRVMQKKRIVDDQGYMVTIQEAAWESFSEDEAPPPSKQATPASTPSSSGAKAKKPAAKGAQGNIMSFFAKK